MSLSYEVTNWENGKTVLKAEHLRKIEKGITDIISENDAIYKDEDTRKSNEKQRQEEHSRKMNEVSEVVSDIQKDYDSLQKIIIDENASANLQNQINQTNSQLEQKMNVGESITIGQIDKNKGKIDETYLSDELLQQIAGNTPIYSTVKDFSLTTRKMGFNVLEGISNGNLFNKYWTIDGFYVSEENGTLLANNEFFVSELIPVKPNTTYTINGTNRYAFYDSEGNFINGAIGTGKNETFTTPSNAYYFRTCNLITSKNLISLVEGDEVMNLESYKVLLDPNSIMDKSISKNKLDFEVPDMIPSKNLFNKNTAIKDKYILYSNGIVNNANGFYASDFIKIEPDTTYIKNNSQQLAFYDNEKKFIEGLKNPVTTFTTPSNSKYVRVTVEDNILDSFQLEKGNESTEYESFDVKIDPKHIQNNNNNTVKNVITVAKENGDYKTINEALSNIKDSKENQITIKLAPGEYVESINTIGRYVSIIGENKDTCIIKTYTNDYYHPPLDCSANNYFANLTVIADDDGITTPVNGVNNLPAYALHFDISGRYNKDLEENQGVARFENVIFISKHQHAAGIGISHNQHLIFENCEFISFNDPAFRAHNYQLEGASNEKMTVRNCVMRNDGTYTPIVLQDPNHYAGADDNRDTVFTFINNTAYNAQGKNNCLDVATPLAEGCIAGYIKLGVGSFGNSIDDLNYNS